MRPRRLFVHIHYDYKQKPDEVMTATTHKEMTNDTNQIRITSGLWQTAVYDSEGDLICFALKKDGDSTLSGFSFGAPKPTVKHATVKKGEQIKSDLWQKSDASPDPNLPLKHSGTVPAKETVTFEAAGNSLCLVAYAPAMGSVFNQQTNALEMQVVGFTRVVSRPKACTSSWSKWCPGGPSGSYAKNPRLGGQGRSFSSIQG